MPSLSGEKIQELLWQEGLDFTYVQTEDDFTALDIPCGIDTIRVERLWSEDNEEWFLDEGDIFISYIRGFSVDSETYSSATTEEELVSEIADLHEKLS